MDNFLTFYLKNLGFFLVIFLSNVFLNTYELFLQHSNISANDLFYSDLLKYFKSFFVVILLSFMLVYIAYYFKKYSKIIMWVVFSINYIIFIIDYFLLTHFNTFINQFMLDAFFRTNFNESFEFFKNYFSIAFGFKAFGFLILHYVLFKINITKTIQNKTNKIINVLIILLMLITVGDVIKKYYKTQLLSYTLVRFESFSITRSICAFLYYKESGFLDYKNLVQDYKNMLLSKDKIIAKNNIKNIILILGESLNKNKMSIYGGGD